MLLNVKKHQKHTSLIKRITGNFAPNEIAVLGTKCNVIAQIVQEVIQNLDKNYKIAYLDASHNADKKIPKLDTFTFNRNGFAEEVLIKTDNSYQLKITFNPYDLVFINGNHYKGEQQILVLDSDKEASVLKRLEQLNNVQFIIKTDPNIKLFPFLTEKYPELHHLKTYDITDKKAIANHIENLIKQQIPRVNGLVLIGGKSTRMGTDKSKINYHGKPQATFLYELLKDKLGEENTYYSVRDKNQILDSSVITDKFLDLGPFGGICSAFQSNPNVAWLVIATDLPNITNKEINRLLQYRNPSKIATAFKGKSKQFPEPLITIWEPKAYPALLQFLTLGYSCPRKVLINNDVEIVEIDDELIQNINTKQELENFQKSN